MILQVGSILLLTLAGDSFEIVMRTLYRTGEEAVKQIVFAILALAATACGAFAGAEAYSGKEMKQVAPSPCSEWYADRELNVGVWGTYLFTGNAWAEDHYLEADHAWGGGLDLKYFFLRYFGIGIEGWVVDARRSFDDIFVDFTRDIFIFETKHENRAVGSVLGTLTLRYPIHCTRFSPYVFAGGGGIFGGGENTEFVGCPDCFIKTRHTGSESRAIGQFGGGLEIRITPHIGWISDFSWNVVDGPENNFGMVRSGLNFAF